MITILKFLYFFYINDIIIEALEMCLRNVLKKFGHYFKKFLKYDNTKEQKKIFG